MNVYAWWFTAEGGCATNSRNHGGVDGRWCYPKCVGRLLTHRTQSRSEDFMTVPPPTGARANTPAGHGNSPTTQTKTPQYTAVRTDQVADLQVIEKKVDANG